MENFQVLGIPEQVLHSLSAMQFTSPTPIQAQTIPHALNGVDVLGSAQTGTGKTAAFGIPLVAYLLKNTTNSALVLTPTRELAMQVHTALSQILGKNSGVKTALLIGGDPMARQLKALSARPRLIVGTPGRLNDHLERGSLMLARSGFLVLDEMDRMLDMGFSEQIDAILKYLPAERQTLMFSATMPPAIEKLARTYLKDAVRISVGSTAAPAEKIEQEVVRITDADKYGALRERLEAHEESVIVFVKTRIGADKLARRLAEDSFSAHALHGDLRQAKRERLIRLFRDQKYRVLVATDVAARGLDISHVGHVINYDLPQNPEDYIHRIGRTGRAGASGKAISFLTSQDTVKWRAILQLISPEEAKLFKGERAEKGRGNKRSSGRFGSDRRSNSEGRGFGRKGFGGGRRFNDRDFRDDQRRDGDRREERRPRFERSERSDRFDRSERPERNERFSRGERVSRGDRFDREGREDRFERQVRFKPFDKPNRFDRRKNDFDGEFAPQRERRDRGEGRPPFNKEKRRFNAEFEVARKPFGRFDREESSFQKRDDRENRAQRRERTFGQKPAFDKKPSKKPFVDALFDSVPFTRKPRGERSEQGGGTPFQKKKKRFERRGDH